MFLCFCTIIIVLNAWGVASSYFQKSSSAFWWREKSPKHLWKKIICKILEILEIWRQLFFFQSRCYSATPNSYFQMLKNQNITTTFQYPGYFCFWSKIFRANIFITLPSRQNAWFFSPKDWNENVWESHFKIVTPRFKIR